MLEKTGLEVNKQDNVAFSKWLGSVNSMFSRLEYTQFSDPDEFKY